MRYHGSRYFDGYERAPSGKLVYTGPRYGFPTPEATRRMKGLTAILTIGIEPADGTTQRVTFLDGLDSYVREHSVDVVALTVPQSVAQDIADRIIGLGVRGFWNFTNVELSSADPDVKFENIHFADSLLTLSYRIANR